MSEWPLADVTMLREVWFDRSLTINGIVLRLGSRYTHTAVRHKAKKIGLGDRPRQPVNKQTPLDWTDKNLWVRIRVMQQNGCKPLEIARKLDVSLAEYQTRIVAAAGAHA